MWNHWKAKNVSLPGDSIDYPKKSESIHTVNRVDQAHYVSVPIPADGPEPVCKPGHRPGAFPVVLTFVQRYIGKQICEQAQRQIVELDIKRWTCNLIMAQEQGSRQRAPVG